MRFFLNVMFDVYNYSIYADSSGLCTTDPVSKDNFRLIRLSAVVHINVPLHTWPGACQQVCKHAVPLAPES